jgi:hydroxymethylglutaryl-CoA lyase
MIDGNPKSAPPAAALLTDVGPRDGFQFEEKIVPTDLKIEIVSALLDAGLRRIQIASFVHPGRVPQMADAEDLFQRLPERPDVRYSALVLNRRGLSRAFSCGVKEVEISVSASDTHGRKNTGMGMEKAVVQAEEMIREAASAGVRVRGSIQCAFGCVYEGPISSERVTVLAERFLAAGAEVLALADTTGMGDPVLIRSRLDSILPAAGSVPVALHLHDTRGLGLVNAAAAFSCGVRRFDTATGGMGGCPFVPGAAGNIATEDAAYLLSRLGADTGVDIEKVSAVTERLEAFFEKRFPVKNRKETLNVGNPSGKA